MPSMVNLTRILAHLLDINTGKNFWQRGNWRRGTIIEPAMDKFQVVSQIRHAGIRGKDKPGDNKLHCAGRQSAKRLKWGSGWTTWVLLKCRKCATCKPCNNHNYTISTEKFWKIESTNPVLYECITHPSLFDSFSANPFRENNRPDRAGLEIQVAKSRENYQREAFALRTDLIPVWS